MGSGGKAVGNGQLPGKVLPGDSVRRQFSSPSGRLRARGAGGIPLGCSCGPGHVSGCCFLHQPHEDGGPSAPFIPLDPVACQLALRRAILEVAPSSRPGGRDAKGSCHQTQRGGSAAQPAGPVSPPKPGRGEPIFRGSLQGPRPRRWGVSPCSPTTPIALQQTNRRAARTPTAARSPSLCIWAPTSKVKRREDALTAGLGVQQISALNIYLITESRESGGRGKGRLLACQCESRCHHHIPPASSRCLPRRQGEPK